MDSMYRRRTDRSDSSWTTNSSKSSSSSVFRTRKVPSYEKQALEQERAAQSARHQWVCSRYEMTWDVLEQFLHRIFPNEIFHEFQSGDYWIVNAPRQQTQQDLDELAGLRARPQPQPHQHRRRAKSPE